MVMRTCVGVRGVGGDSERGHGLNVIALGGTRRRWCFREDGYREDL